MSSLSTCLACSGGRLKPVADLGDSPVLTGALFDDRRSARAAVTGRLDLAACLDCGHVQNVAFDAALVQYDVSYDNSLHFSPTFQRYADDLVSHLVKSYDIRRRRIVEIGSGKGDFLASLVRSGHNVGTGYDPTAEPDTSVPGVTLIRDYFHPGERVADYDLLVCRHVLEHLDDPAALLRSLRESAPEGALYYFEVPSAEFNFGPDGLWDCIYPHVSYFSMASLATLMWRSGFQIVSLRRSFHGQFLSLEARPGRHSAEKAHDVHAHLDLVASFAERWHAAVGLWRGEAAQLRSAGRGLAMWGAGSKGVNFVNAVDPDGSIAVVDLNPRKSGRYLPGAGHRVDLPESLTDSSVSTVVVMNPAYRAEIAERLDELRVDAAVVTV